MNANKCNEYMYAKYSLLPRHVASLEPTAIAQIFKQQISPNTFYPAFGIFFSEFSLGYCYNLHKT